MDTLVQLPAHDRQNRYLSKGGEAGRSLNASGTATTVNRIGVISRGGSSGWDLNAPGETVWGTPQLDSIGVGVGQAPAAFGTGKFVPHRVGGDDFLKRLSLQLLESAALDTSQPSSLRKRLTPPY